MPFNNNYQAIVFKGIYLGCWRATVSLLYSCADWAINLLDGQTYLSDLFGKLICQTDRSDLVARKTSTEETAAKKHHTEYWAGTK